MSAQLNFDTIPRATITVPVSLLPHFGSIDIDAVRESWSTTEMTRGDGAESEGCLVVDCGEVVGGADGEVVLRCKARFVGA